MGQGIWKLVLMTCTNLRTGFAERELDVLRESVIGERSRLRKPNRLSFDVGQNPNLLLSCAALLIIVQNC